MNQPGKILRIGNTEQITDSLRKRELILEIPGNYPQTVKFEAVNDKCELLDSIRTGENVNVHFNLNGREAKGNVYNTLSLYKVE